MEFNNNIESIHCKVSYDGQIRRFALAGTEFTSLRVTISQLFSLNNEFVLKYKDDESDYVTLENQQDFITAIMISPKLLRVLVETKNNAMEATESPSSPSDDPCMKHGRKRYNYHQYHHQHQPHKSNEHRRFRIEKKLQFINLALQDMADDSKLNPREQWKKQKLLQKKERIEAFLNGDFRGHHGNCRHSGKKEKRILTPEEEQFNCALKFQMMEIKAEKDKLKQRQKEIKMLLQSTPQDPQLLQQLTVVKEEKRAMKAQKRDLCHKMHS